MHTQTPRPPITNAIVGFDFNACHPPRPPAGRPQISSSYICFALSACPRPARPSAPPAPPRSRVIAQGLIDAGERLTLVEADLVQPESWPAAVDGCTYVCHVASPFVFGISDKDADTLIKPAVDGTLNVLRPCMANEVHLYKYKRT